VYYDVAYPSSLLRVELVEEIVEKAMNAFPSYSWRYGYAHGITKASHSAFVFLQVLDSAGRFSPKTDSTRTDLIRECRPKQPGSTRT
jgi:hypothetical protein